MIRVEFELYGQWPEGHDWDSLDWEWLRERWPGRLPEKKPEYRSVPGQETIPYDLANELATRVPLRVLPLPGAMLTKMHDGGQSGIFAWEHRPVRPEHLQDGRAVQISIPDLALMYIREVTHLNDCCTDELQRHLDDGWRILAVCPPNAQRRPDYILGRTKND